MDIEHLDNIEKIIDLLDDKPELKKSMLYFFIRFNDMKSEIENFVKAEPYSSDSEISNEEELEYEVDEKGFYKLK
tara:strand:+ start:5904 stop:6128 length:225 start_codon:yes stop_codon:yes gene_type:complete